MDINIPEIIAEVQAEFDRYEIAINANDAQTLIDIFWDHPLTIRYGGGENLYGADAIKNFRNNRPATDLRRRIGATVITTFGRDFATASTLYQRIGSGLTGRQMQTWVRMPEGWRVVAAHVSMVPYEFPKTEP